MAAQKSAPESCQDEHQHPTCEDCKRPVRPPRTTREHHPGTMSPYRATLCGGCRQHRVRGTKRVGQTRFMGTECIHCKTTLRPRDSNPEDHPETTVEHHSRGACRSCYNRIRDRERNVEKRDQKRRKAAEAARGPNRSLLQMPARPPGLEGADAAARKSLEDYMLIRRGRRVPVQGLNLQAWAIRNRVDA